MHFKVYNKRELKENGKPPYKYCTPLKAECVQRICYLFARLSINGWMEITRVKK